MSINIIVAMDKNGLIGKDGKLPWHLPSDLQFFRTATLGRIVVMGSKTAASIGRPLPNRTSIILSRSSGISIQDIVDLSKRQDVFIIGGSQIYEAFLPYTDKLIITHIDAAFDGDAWFPEYNKDDFKLVDNRKGIDSASGLSFAISFYKRKVA
jgi:dihydrofolate reductase